MHETVSPAPTAEVGTSQVCRPAVSQRVCIEFPPESFSPNMAGRCVGTVVELVMRDEVVVGVDVEMYPDGFVRRVIFDEYEQAGVAMRPWTTKDGWKAAREKREKPKLKKRDVKRMPTEV